MLFYLFVGGLISSVPSFLFLRTIHKNAGSLMKSELVHISSDSTTARVVVFLLNTLFLSAVFFVALQVSFPKFNPPITDYLISFLVAGLTALLLSIVFRSRGLLWKGTILSAILMVIVGGLVLAWFMFVLVFFSIAAVTGYRG